MNANELAKCLEVFGKWVGGEHKLLTETATTLRLQQEKLTKYELRNEEQRNRITHLEAEIDVLQKECNYWNTLAIERGKAQER